MNSKWFLFCLLLLLIFTLPVLAEQGASTSQSTQSTKGNIKAGHMRGKQKENVYIFTENVRLDYKDIQVNADKLRMNRDEDTAYFTGNVHLIRNQSGQKKPEEIWSKELEFDMQKEILIAKQNVKLESTKNERPLKLTSEYLKLWTQNNDMLAKDDVFVDYDGQKIKGEKLNYTAQEDKMVVTEQVEVKENNNWMQSKKAVFWLEDDVLEAEGKVEMEFEVDD